MSFSHPLAGGFRLPDCFRSQKTFAVPRSPSTGPCMESSVYERSFHPRSCHLHTSVPHAERSVPRVFNSKLLLRRDGFVFFGPARALEDYLLFWCHQAPKARTSVGRIPVFLSVAAYSSLTCRLAFPVLRMNLVFPQTLSLPGTSLRFPDEMCSS